MQDNIKEINEEEKLKLELIQQARNFFDERSSAERKKIEDNIQTGYTELRKIFPHLKQIHSDYWRVNNHCEVFGYDFRLEGPDAEGRFYLNKVGGDNFDVYRPTFRTTTNIYTEQDMAKLLYIWNLRLKNSLEHLENYLKCPKSYAKPHNYQKLMRIRNKDKPTSPVNQSIPGGGCLLFIMGFIIIGIFGVCMI